MAAGRVGIGASNIYVAAYSNTAGTTTYSDGVRLGRLVNVSFSLDDAGDNVFYADNVAAESAGSVFGGGTMDIEIDGLLDDTEKFIFGLEDRTAVTVGTATSVAMYGDGANSIPPYVGIGFIVAEMEDGVTSYKPVIIMKARFQKSARDAHTMEDTIDWQTQTLTAQLHRDDTANHDWRQFGENCATEADAEAVIKSVLSIS